MENTTLLVPTLHVEVLLKNNASTTQAKEVASGIRNCIVTRYDSLKVNETISGYDNYIESASLIESCSVADFTGPKNVREHHKVEKVQLDIQTYFLRTGLEIGGPRRRISQPNGANDDVPQARVLALPNVALAGEWDSLVYDDGLPSRLLRYLTRMLGVMKQPNLDMATFNWNRLVLLHGPPGSGKSTLCRALAQKLSIRLSATFPQSVLVEVNTNAMLSKYFGESGKLIGNLFEKINGLARSPTTLVCVVIDEVETIAGSRQKATDGGECSDGLRATNQLLTALDKLRALPNLIVLCTSNMIGAMDPAFLDRVDIKELIPSPSPAAIYNIFRSCLNELVRTRVVETTVMRADPPLPARLSHSPPSSASVPAKRRALGRARGEESPGLSFRKLSSPLPGKTSSSSTINSSPVAMQKASSSANKESQAEDPPIEQSASSRTEIEQSMIPTYLEQRLLYRNKPDSHGGRVETLAKKCEGFSGRTLRRLPILGLAMYTWGGDCSLQDAISALESAVEQELRAKSA